MSGADTMSPAPKVDALAAMLDSIADELNLPGKAAARDATARDPGQKRPPWAARNAYLLRLALELLPNDGAYDYRDDWMYLAHTVKGAAVRGGFEAEVRDAWLEFCARWHLGGDPEHDAAAWDGISGSRTGWGSLMREVERHNPAGREMLRQEEARHAFGLEAAANRAALSSFQLAPVAPFDPTKLPPRDWLYDRSYIRGFLSVLVSPGGVGKSALTMAEAVAMARDKPVLPSDTRHGPKRVWLHNAEDSFDEMRRRLTACLKHHSLTQADLAGRLFMSSGRQFPLQLARMVREGPEVVPGMVDNLVDRLTGAKIDVLIIDPLGAVHTLPENSNEAANLLMGALREVAERAGVAILLVHYTSKAAAMDMATAGAGASRGASAFVDAARDVRQAARMTTKEAIAFGIAESERWRYFRVDRGKANLAPAGGARWYRLVSVPLDNPSAQHPKGDDAQTVEEWTPPTGVVSLSGADRQAVADALNSAPAGLRRSSQRSPHWAGYAVAEALGLEIDPHGTRSTQRTPDQASARRRAADILSAGLGAGWLREVQETGDDRKPYGNVVAALAAAELDDADE